MINFRYHLVSIIAVFLALGIGIIMGTAVIDRAVVDRLERQQSGLQSDIDNVQSENGRLRSELNAERDAAKQLADEGSQRLLIGSLPQVPVLVVGIRGGRTDGLDDLITLLGRAGAANRGTIWLTDRFLLDDDGEVQDLADALGLRPEASPGSLRGAAITRLVRALRVPADGTVLTQLRTAGFLDYDPPEGAPDDVIPVADSSTRIVVVSNAQPDVPDRALALPLVRNLVAPRDDQSPAPTLVVEALPSEDQSPEDQQEPTLVRTIRDDRDLASRLSTVDDIDDFAGRLAAVLALADLGGGRLGHFGVGEGAQRLLPAPSE